MSRSCIFTNELLNRIDRFCDKCISVYEIRLRNAVMRTTGIIIIKSKNLQDLSDV